MTQTKVIKTIQTHDNSLAVTIRANDDPLSDSTLTIYNAASMTEEQLEEAIARHHQKVAARAVAMQRVKDKLTALGIVPVEHEPKVIEALLNRMKTVEPSSHPTGSTAPTRGRK